MYYCKEKYIDIDSRHKIETNGDLGQKSTQNRWEIGDGEKVIYVSL